MAIFKKATVTQTEIKPTTFGVKVTDFTSGESVKTTTTTSPSGTTTVTRQARSSGGGSVSPQREEQLISATQSLEQSQAERQVAQAKQTTEVSRQRQVDQQRQVAQATAARNEQSQQQQFSGKVAEYDSNQTTPARTRYYVKGNEVGSTFVQEGKTYSETKQPAVIVTKSGNVEERTTFSKQGAQVESTTYEQQTVSPSGSVSPPTSQSPISKAYNYVKGLFNTPVNIPIFVIPGAKISVKETKDLFSQASAGKGLPARTAAEFYRVIVPETYGGSAVLTAGVAGFGYLPAIARFGVSSYIGYEGAKGAFNPQLPTETRIVSGTFGVLGAAGATAETLPYIRGIIARFSPKYKPVETAPEGFKVIETPELGTKVGLIPPGYPSRSGVTSTVELPGRSPLVRGGFHRRPGGESIFIGEGQQLATSQIGLFKQGKEIGIEREFFVTPQEPFLKIAETRVSRLGLGEDFFSIPKSTTIGFGVPGKPQIGIVQAGVRRSESSFSFKLGTGTELEAIKTYGTITNIKKVGTTIIQGQGVDIFSFSIGKVSKKSLINVYSGATTETSTRISGEGLFATTYRTRKTSTKAPTTTRAILTSLSISTGKINFTTGATSNKRSTGRGSSGRTSDIFSPGTSTPFSPTRSPPTSTRITPPFSPPFTLRKSPPASPPRSPPGVPIRSPPGRTTKLERSRSRNIFPGFNVFVRRQGRFRQIGNNLSFGGAFNLGKTATQKGLSQTFTVRGTGGRAAPFRLPKGYYAKRSRKEGIVYIETPRSKINTRSEKLQLNFARMLKGGSNKRVIK